MKEISTDNLTVQDRNWGTCKNTRAHTRGCAREGMRTPTWAGFALKRSKIGKRVWGSLLSTPNSDHRTTQLTHSTDGKSADNTNNMKPQTEIMNKQIHMAVQLTFPARRRGLKPSGGLCEKKPSHRLESSCFACSEVTAKVIWTKLSLTEIESFFDYQQWPFFFFLCILW